MHKLPSKNFRVTKSEKEKTAYAEEKRCPVCQHEIDPNWKFCKNCGFKLYSD